MKTTVVCGLLGSGKTTFIKNRLQHSSEKTVVLVNDFGKAGIDGEIFSAGGIEAVELPSGCVCCTLKFDLVTTVAKIMKEFSPEHLMIEPSGVASPSGVLEALESAGIGTATVVGIVDATEFTELYRSGMYGSFFEDQIVHSDVILVNKTDVAGEQTIVETIRLIESINSRAVLVRTVNASLIDGNILFSSSKTAAATISQNLLPFGERTEVRGKKAHFHFETLSFKLNDDASLTLFSSFFNDLARGRFGSVARAKALVHTDKGPYRFDAVFGNVDRVPFEKEIVDSRLVVIGEGLNKEMLERSL